MKIFNWFNRKFGNKGNNNELIPCMLYNFERNNQLMTEDDSTAENGSSGSGTGTGDDDEIWSGGILSIGTLGYDHLKDHLYEEESEMEQVAMQYEDEMMGDDDSGKEEMNPLVYVVNKREFEYVMMEKKERITLGDLFSDDDKKEPLTEGSNCKKKKKTHTHTHVGFSSLAKKPRPINKLHQMMSRMLKRKIHPDLNSQVPVKKCDVHASLLPTDTTI